MRRTGTSVFTMPISSTLFRWIGTIFHNDRQSCDAPSRLIVPNALKWRKSLRSQKT